MPKKRKGMEQPSSGTELPAYNEDLTHEAAATDTRTEDTVLYDETREALRMDVDMTATVEFDKEIIEPSLQGTATEVETGGVTPGGVSQDFTTDTLEGGKRIGGPTGGDVYGAGAAPAHPEFPERNPNFARGEDHPIMEEDETTGMAQKVAAMNARTFLEENVRRPKS